MFYLIKKIENSNFWRVVANGPYETLRPLCLQLTDATIVEHKAMMGYPIMSG